MFLALEYAQLLLVTLMHVRTVLNNCPHYINTAVLVRVVIATPMMFLYQHQSIC